MAKHPEGRSSGRGMNRRSAEQAGVSKAPWNGIETLEPRVLLSADQGLQPGGLDASSSAIEVEGTLSPVLIIPDNLPGSPGGTVTVPVSIDDATDIAFASINVFFDPAVLEIASTDVSFGDLWLGVDGWSLTPNALPGQVVIILFNAGGQATATGGGVIAELEFTVKADAPNGVTDLDIEPIDPNEGGLNWSGSDGSILVGVGTEVQLSIPEGILAAPGQTVPVPVFINDATGVAFASIDVFFDDSLLEISNGAVEHGSLWPVTDGWSLTPNAMPGQVRVILFNGGGLAPATGTGQIAVLNFTVKPGVATPQDTPLDIEPVDPNEGGLNWSDSDGSIAIRENRLICDVNNDGRVNNLDTTPFMTALTVGGNELLFDILVPGGSFIAADVNEDGFVNFLDIDSFIGCLVDAALATASGGGTVDILAAARPVRSAAVRSSSTPWLADDSSDDALAELLGG